MNILYMGGHAILEYDELRLFHSLGHKVFSLGAYITPSEPHEDKRPPLFELEFHAKLKAVVDGLNQRDNLDAAKVHIPDELLEWADVLIFAAYEWRWLAPQWERIKHKRVIWRCIGQSMENNEQVMAPLFKQGCQIVRYSPKERNIPSYAGESALIRFVKDPSDWYGWTGHEPVVANVTQHMRSRGDSTGFRFWQDATVGLTRSPAGPGSDEIGGVGILPYDQMRDYLRASRAYLYTGTIPASYTLGLIEAMMTGVPVVSIGPRQFGAGSYVSDMFEAHEITGLWSDTVTGANTLLKALLNDADYAAFESQRQQARAIELFGSDAIKAQWAAILG